MTVHELVLRDFSANEVSLSVSCSKGFFVRVLAQDVGRALGCGAHLKSLRRTRSGPFLLAQALPLDVLMAQGTEGLAEAARRLVPMAAALSELPSLQASEAEAVKVSHGVPFETSAGPGKVRVLSAGGRLLAVAQVEGGRLKYLRVL